MYSTALLVKTDEKIDTECGTTDEFIVSYSQRLIVPEIMVFPIIDGEIEYIDLYCERGCHLNPNDCENVFKNWLDFNSEM
jgi:hypothetical protein